LKYSEGSFSTVKMAATGFSETMVSVTELHDNIKSQKINLIFAAKGNLKLDADQ